MALIALLHDIPIEHSTEIVALQVEFLLTMIEFSQPVRQLEMSTARSTTVASGD